MAGLDSINSMGKEMECSICLRTWSDPKTLPCSHVFCEGCLAPLVSRERHPHLTCPECRLTHVVPREGLQNSWHTQRTLVNLANSMRRISIPEREMDLPCSKIDPHQSSLEFNGLKKARAGAAFVLTVKLRDNYGLCIDPRLVASQVTAFMELSPSSTRKEPVSLIISANGEYHAVYQTLHCGLHKFTVAVGDTPIRNSPVVVEIGPRGIAGCEVKGPLKGPRDVVCYGEHFLITDGFERAVFLIDHAGRQLRRLPLQSCFEKSFSPMAIATHRGRVFVTDMGNSCVHVYNDLDHPPNQVDSRHFPHLEKPTGIAVSPVNGNVFVVDNIRKHVSVFELGDRGPRLVRLIQFPPSSQSGLNNPQLAAMNSQGDHLLIADQDDSGHNCIKVVNVAKNKINKRINVRLGQLQTKPYGIAVSKRDIIYVSVRVVPSASTSAVTPRKGPRDRGASGDVGTPEKNPRGSVLAYNMMGHFLGVFGNLPYQLDCPGGIVIAEDAGDPSIAYVVDSPGRGKNGSLKGFIV